MNRNEKSTIEYESKEQALHHMMERLLLWYPSVARDLPWRRDNDPYHVWLSEIMLQQTRVEAVKEYYKRFLSALPTIYDLAYVSEDELLKLWQGLGYYNRARNLKKAAITVEETYQGVFPGTYDQIRDLAGIGDYTAGAIGSICFDLPTPAVDGNVLRVHSRVFEDGRIIDSQRTKKQVTEELGAVYPGHGSGTLNQALMELGATVCIPNGAPHCEVCPISCMCRARANDTWKQYPVRQEKKKRKVIDKTVLVMLCDGKVALRKRGSQGLLASMWEFPNIDQNCDKQEAIHVAEGFNTMPETIYMETRYTHIFSHVEWNMTAYFMEVRNQTTDFVWVDRGQLETKYAVPSAFAPFQQILCEWMESGT